jgi:hypothetical protein
MRSSHSSPCFPDDSDVESLPSHEIGNALGLPAGHYLGKAAPQQQARCRQDVVVVVNDEDGAVLAHCSASKLSGIVHSLSASVQFGDVGQS